MSREPSRIARTGLHEDRQDAAARPDRARGQGGYAKTGASEPGAGQRRLGRGSASVLGIPEAEFTPRVRDAIMTLMNEVDRLRHEVEQARAKLEDMARTADQDMLLPILNRRAFVREITRFIAFAERYGTPSSLIYFDLDDFKSVNDAHGHAAGDDVLRHFSDADPEPDARVRCLRASRRRRIRSHPRPCHCGPGGEEGRESRRRRSSDHPPMIDGKAVRLSFSYGVYELRAGETPDSAMRQADHAMYAQKRSQT